MDLSRIEILSKDELVELMNQYHGQVVFPKAKTLSDLSNIGAGYFGYLCSERQEYYVSEIIKEINAAITVQNKEKREIYNKLESRFIEITSNVG